MLGSLLPFSDREPFLFQFSYSNNILFANIAYFCYSYNNLLRKH